MATPAEHARRYRERQSAGTKVVKVVADPVVIDRLIERGFLEEWDEQDREAIAKAIEKCLRQA